MFNNKKIYEHSRAFG